MGNQNKQALKGKQQKIEPITIKFSTMNQETFNQLMIPSHPKHIQSLSLPSCKLGSTGIKRLIQAQWPQLEILNLQENRLGNNGVKHLVKMQCKALRIINLKGNGLRDEACKILTKGDWLGLQYLTLNENYGKEKRLNRINQIGCRYIIKIPVNLRETVKPTKTYRYYYNQLDQVDLLG